MPGLLAKIFPNLLDKAVDAVDRFVTTKEEKAKLTQEITTIVNDFQIKAQEQITERHRIDMQSDSWLSKNIRPMIMIFSLSLYTVFSILDGNVGAFNINDAYVSLLAQINMLGLGFYFGGRTAEKLINTWRK